MLCKIFTEGQKENNKQTNHRKKQLFVQLFLTEAT